MRLSGRNSAYVVAAAGSLMFTGSRWGQLPAGEVEKEILRTGSVGTFTNLQTGVVVTPPPVALMEGAVLPQSSLDSTN